MSLKQKIYDRCYSLLEEKINSLKIILSELEEGAKNDTKSSAGDKHETARAMMQLEQEKISRQLKDYLKQKLQLEKIGANVNPSEITQGSLVKTDKGYLFLSVALGEIQVDQNSVMVISPRSPLGIKLTGLKKNDTAEING